MSKAEEIFSEVRSMRGVETDSGTQEIGGDDGKIRLASGR
jgi:hypothetical protein